jgi:hypothetical protein
MPDRELRDAVDQNSRTPFHVGFGVCNVGANNSSAAVRLRCGPAHHVRTAHRNRHLCRRIATDVSTLPHREI